MTTISVLGLGAMGSALAKAFLDNGYATTVWNRTEAKANDLQAQGATKADTIRQAIEASDTVVLCVVTNDVVHAILDEAGDAVAGKTIVNLTNGTPNQARDLAVRVTKQHAEYLDGGIMAVPPMIGTDAAYVFYSGPQHVFDQAQKALSALGGTKYVGADAGLAALYDLALLTGMYGQTIGHVQALALIRSAGVEAEPFMRDLLDPWMKAMGAFSAEFARQVDSGNHTENVVSPLGMQAAAFHNLIDAAGEQGVSGDLFVPFQKLLYEAVDKGHSDADLSVLVELLRRQPQRLGQD